VRFVPKTNFNGNVYLGYRAWDRTQGTPGSLFDLTGHLGGENAFSTLQKSAKLKINPINDAPILKSPVNPLEGELIEDAIASDNDGALVKDIIFGKITDPDAGALKGIAVIDEGPDADGDWQFSLNNGAS